MIILAGTATCESKASFLEEIELMKKVSTTSNNHIVQLIGYVLLEEPMAMVMEYIPFGDLHSNLIKWKEQVKLYISCYQCAQKQNKLSNIADLTVNVLFAILKYPAFSLIGNKFIQLGQAGNPPIWHRAQGVRLKAVVATLIIISR